MASSLLKPMSKQKYNSRYSPDKKVTCAQLIIEIVCENRAVKDDKELPIKFWDLDEWNKFYRMQLRYCHKLCKAHTPSKVLAFIWQKKIWDLRAKWLDEAVSEFVFNQEEPDIVFKVNQRTTECKGLETGNEASKKLNKLIQDLD